MDRLVFLLVCAIAIPQVQEAHPRNLLRLADAGTLQPGKSADFIVLDANPLEDITNTRRIASVVLRGAAVDRTQRLF
jgi:imidazolonepropionase-like amidohydrolase